jgi:hypothetical protein
MVLTLLLVTSLVIYITYSLMSQPPKANESDISMLAPHNDLVVQVRIFTAPITINGTTRFLADVDSVKDQLANGKVQVSLRGMLSARRGDQVTVTGDLQKARPGDTFLRNRQVFSQLLATKIMKGDKVLYIP